LIVNTTPKPDVLESNGPSKIHTTGQLREFLSDMLSNVRSGSIDLDAARTMVKIAAQINESFYSEIKVAQVQLESKQERADLGDLPLGGKPKACQP
jgi:hypothetical protein